MGTLRWFWIAWGAVCGALAGVVVSLALGSAKSRAFFAVRRLRACKRRLDARRLAYQRLAEELARWRIESVPPWKITKREVDLEHKKREIDHMAAEAARAESRAATLTWRD